MLDNARLRDARVQIAAKFDLGRLEAPTGQTMAQDLLHPGTHDESGATHEIYSQLSGPAHAAMSVVGMYVGSDTGRFILPDQIAEDQVAYLFAATCGVVDAWMMNFGSAGAPYEGWVAARRGAEAKLVQSNPALQRHRQNTRP